MKTYRLGAIALGALALVLMATRPAEAQFTFRASVDSSGTQGNDVSEGSSLSGNGRFVAFESDADNLVAGDTNGFQDVFVHDRMTGTTIRVSVDSAGVQGNNASFAPRLNLDARYVTFWSRASNLVPGDTNGVNDAFLHDLWTGAVERVNVSTSGEQTDHFSTSGSVSADGSIVSFQSMAANLDPNDTNRTWDVYVRDRVNGTTERVSVGSGGEQADTGATGGGLSADGRLVLFKSGADNLVPGDTNGSADIFLHDRLTGTTTRVSLDANGNEADGESVFASISPDGLYVAFDSHATNLVPGDTNGKRDVFLRHLPTGTMTRVSIDSQGNQGNKDTWGASVSAGGSRVGFHSFADNLVVSDTNRDPDVFVHEVATGVTRRTSVSSLGAQSNERSSGGGLSADGRFQTFRSWASNLVPGDTNGVRDVFVHGPELTLVADPAEVNAGDLVELRTWKGTPGNRVGLFLVDDFGDPMTPPLALGAFAIDGAWRTQHRVPTVLGGMQFVFRSYAIGMLGNVVASGDAVLVVL